jgi:hypothetical protein
MTSGCFQNKVCVKGTKVSGYWRYPKRKKKRLWH